MPSSLQAVDDLGRVVPALTARVHTPCQSYDSMQSNRRQVFTSHHSLADVCEQFEVLLLTGKQLVRLKMRNDSSHQDREASHFPFECPVAPVWSQCPAPEVLLHQQEDLGAITILTDRQTRPHFPADDDRRSR